MDKTRLLNLSISTRIISQLGEQLISDEIVALMELIKNSYDADATKVTINVDTKAETSYGIGRIEIKDNGNGMTPYIIEKGFLRISKCNLLFYILNYMMVYMVSSGKMKYRFLQ